MRIIIYLIVACIAITPTDYLFGRPANQHILSTILDDNRATMNTIQVNPSENTGQGKKESAKPAQQHKSEIPAPSTKDKVLLETGISLLDAHAASAAIKKFMELKKTFPQSPYLDQASLWLAKSYFQNNSYEKALQELENIKDDSGEYPASLYLAGRIYMHQKKYNQAQEAFYNIASLSPGHDLADNALIKLCSIYLYQEKGNEAVAAAISVIKNYADRDQVDDAYYQLGKIFEKDPFLRDLEKARKIYKKFIYKATIEKDRNFATSPLLNRVKRDLHYIETYFLNASVIPQTGK